jgi:RNA polymerase sigma factor (sigma-70 family)
MSNGPVTDTDAPWRELTGYVRHEACLIAARDGDRGALHALVVDLQPLVWHVARSQGLDRTVVEDVVQTVWMTFMRNMHAVAEPRALARWLITTARREALKIKGGAERVEPLADDALERLESHDGLPEAELLLGERNRQLWDAFAQLTLRCQQLVRLTVIAGRADYGEVAEALGIPRGSIGPTRGRCLSTLRGYLNTNGGKP